MAQIQIDHIWKYFSAEPVLADVALDIRPGARIGLIGPNGCGKTTLLRILANELEPDRGKVMRRKGVRVGYLKQGFDGDPGQTVWDFAHTAFDAIHRLASESQTLAAALADASDRSQQELIARQFDQVQRQLHQVDGFQLDYKVERVLHGLGFSPAQHRQTVGTLSGGQINRLMLAHLLISAPDVMLLDEPSNHLDLKATEWLEDFLRGTPSAYVVVSHDRYLLDRVTEQTVELLSGKIDIFPGNYSKYVKLKSERLEVQRRTYEKQQLEIEKLEDFVRRNHYGQKATQAEDRRKKLAQIERVEMPREVEVPPMSFSHVGRCGDIVLRTQRLGKSFDRRLFDDLTMQIERGERWGILGANGSGKTTFLRCLLESDFEFDGQVKWGSGVQVGYFDQHLLCVADDVTPLEAVRPTHKEMVDQQRRDLLARFGITGDTALQSIDSLSGGQRNRVALARLAASDANMLVMDEPTNHLDLWSREALAAALHEFDGTVLVVSHDRYFLNQLCNHLLVLGDERSRVVEGNYDTLRMLDAAERATGGETESALSTSRVGQDDRPRRKRRFPYRKVEDIEAEISQRESLIKGLESELCDPAVLRSRERVLDATNRLEEETERVKLLYEHWHEASELN